MPRLASVEPRTHVVVHVLAVDRERRLLLDRSAAPGETQWALPAAQLSVGEDPVERVRDLVREAGGRPEGPQVVALDSVLDGPAQWLHLLFECRSIHGLAAPNGGGRLWWTLTELTGLSLSARTRKAILTRWPAIWPDH
jgi:ADP-ribose pyrophosphatase YjhB (NUDIX family)